MPPEPQPPSQSTTARAVMTSGTATATDPPAAAQGSCYGRGGAATPPRGGRASAAFRLLHPLAHHSGVDFPIFEVSATLFHNFV